MTYEAKAAIDRITGDQTGAHPANLFEDFEDRHHDARWFDTGHYDAEQGCEYLYHCFRWSDGSVAVLARVDPVPETADPDAGEFAVLWFSPDEAHVVHEVRSKQWPAFAMTDLVIRQHQECDQYH